jgi:hypothetical protein
MISSLKRFWAKLNISQKIIFPFLAVCLSVLILSLLTTVHWLTSSLEQNLSEEVKSFAERVYQDFQGCDLNIIQLLGGNRKPILIEIVPELLPTSRS